MTDSRHAPLLRLAAALFRASGAALLRGSELLAVTEDEAELAAALARGEELEGLETARVELGAEELLVWSRQALAAPQAEVLEALRPLLSTGETGPTPRVIGRSPAMKRLMAAVEKIAASRVSVLIQGETGTGKEVLARELHARSPRGDKVFVSLNCSAINRSLLESELFGHIRGAFTGATEDRAGYFEQADGGSLFLDELQDMSPEMQRELLRVLQDGEVMRVGAKRALRVDVRVIAASNTELGELVERGAFRRDLFYRLNVVTLDIPPLRRRREDIPFLVDEVLERLARRYDRPKPGLEAAALEQLLAHPWPGNIRELQNLLEKSLLLFEGAVLRAEDLELDDPGRLASGPLASLLERPYKEAKELFLRRYLEDCLDRHQGNVTRAAESAGLLRSSFHKMLRKHGLRQRDQAAETQTKVL